MLGEDISDAFEDNAVRKCGLFGIEVYLERRRGTLRKYLEENRRDLLNAAEVAGIKYGSNSGKLWWEQKWIDKDDLKEMKNLIGPPIRLV